MNTPSIIADNAASGVSSDEVLATLGQWFWVKGIARWDGDFYTTTKKGDSYEWLACVMHIGSNYVKVESPPNDGASYSARIHFDEFWKEMRAEPNAEQAIRAKADAAQAHVSGLMAQVQELTQRLGVVPQTQIAQQGEGGGLAIITAQVDAKAYETSLVKAKNEDLPELFKKIERGHKTLVSWLSAGALPAKAMAGSMKGVIGAVEDRLFTVSLYAGLTEEAVQCSEGEPAAMGEPLRIMQRRLYMDEECLLSYVPGGITMEKVEDFDRWISEPENRDRLLPFPRTLVAFRVRHREADRETGNILQSFINMQLAQADKTTFLYVRNGDQVWRIDCDFTFGAMIFPTETGLGVEPMMVDKSWASDVKLITLREYEDRLARWQEQTRVHEEWSAANIGVNSFHNPHHVDGFSLSNYEPFDAGSVYHDDGLAKVAAEMKQNNRLAVIVQGLFDRSLVLHPHPPVKVWDQHSFERSVELVRDGESLSAGDMPDFGAYRRRLNQTLGPGSIVTGQEDVWMRKEAEKENERQRNDHRNKHPSNYIRYRPYGNDGPGLISEIAEWKPRSRKAVFRWVRDAGWRSSRDVIPCSVEIESDLLFNVSAYTTGDFKQFYADHRMREQYLRWAPLMLAAEDYHAGKSTLGKPKGSIRS